MNAANFSRKLYIRIASIVALIGVVLSFASGVGAFFVGQTVHFELTGRFVEQLAQSSRKTAAIAVYLDDEELAREIINGLETNDLVMAAHIRNLDDSLVIGNVPEDAPIHSDLTLYSPFIEGVAIGQLQVYADSRFIHHLAVKDATRSAVQMLGLSLIITLAVSGIMYVLLTRPLRRLIKALLRIDPNQPEDLRIIDVKYRHQDEIGHIISRINGLITALREKFVQEKSLRLETEQLQHRFRLLFERATAGIALLSLQNGMVTRNSAFADILGEVESVQSFADLFADPQQIYDVLGELQKHNRQQQASLDLRFMKNGQPHWVHCLFARISDQRLVPRADEDVLIELIINDITDRMAREEQAQYEASHDALTQLYNRRGGKDALQALWQKAQQHKQQFVLMVIDLDEFKPINDSFGHEVGDEVLRQVSQRIRQQFASYEHVCMRWGGDEFITGVIVDAGANSFAEQLCQALRASISSAIEIGDAQSVSVSASIGTVVAGEKDIELETLISRADKLMYRVKKHHRS